VVHIGVAQFGHYISYIRNGPVWLEFNDSLVSDFDPANLEKQCFGGAVTHNFMEVDLNNKSAYMLIYEKRVKHEFLILEQPRFPLDHKIFKHGVRHLGDNKHAVDFSDFPQLIPEKIRRQVQDSNQQFMLQKNLFNEQFIDFLDNLLQMIPPDYEHPKAVLEVYVLFIMKILARSKQNQVL